MQTDPAALTDVELIAEANEWVQENETCVDQVAPNGLLLALASRLSDYSRLQARAVKMEEGLRQIAAVKPGELRPANVTPQLFEFQRVVIMRNIARAALETKADD